ncbi:MAG: acyloxyacyl hydrolase [Thalassobaculaceae bacterium]|nr:acyloxyacyl hydrolase [Thalassobaculaceae bacterium]
MRNVARLFTSPCRAAAVLCSLVLGALGHSGPAHAQDIGADPAFLSFGVGVFDIVENTDRAGDFRVEYRHGDGLWIFKPWIGLEVTTDGGVFANGGVLTDFYFGRRVVVTPSIGVGAYRNGGGLDMGNTFEIRSQLEVAYRFDDRSRLGLAFSHISNAWTGDENPGSEILTVYYSVPLDRLFGE